jgi:hypothetical protein
MDHRTVRVFSVAITAFIPWLITLAALGTASMFPRPMFIVLHYVLVVLLFGVAFVIYYHGHKGLDPFTVMGIAVLSILVFDFVQVSFFYEGELWFLTWVDWFVPLFLIASTIYGLGKFFR